MKKSILSKIKISSLPVPLNTPSKHTEINFQYFQNLVMRYVYQETSTLENNEVEKLLRSNEKLNQFFYEIVNLKKQMDDCQTRHKPSPRVLDRILNYSKK